MNENGKVWLVGSGPGDSGLLTIKGKAANNHKVSQNTINQILVEQALMGKKWYGERYQYITENASCISILSEKVILGLVYHS